jgi:hypothetical protein
MLPFNRAHILSWKFTNAFHYTAIRLCRCDQVEALVEKIVVVYPREPNVIAVVLITGTYESQRLRYDNKSRG